MKQILLVLLVLGSFSINAQQKAKTVKAAEVKAETVVQPAPAPATFEVAVPTTKAKMEFESLTVDYGTIAKDSDPLRVVKFTNTGTEPLVITNARGSCGCTVPTFPREPIAPGQSSTIEVRYATDRVGAINKSITISTNEGPDTHVLQVVGNVLEAEQPKAVPAAPASIIKGN